MNYKDYQKSRDLVWKILLREGVRALPVGVVPLCRQMDIAVKLYEGAGEDGYTQMVDGQPVIFINRSTASRGRKRFTAAHELGHVLLGHVGKYAPLVNREPVLPGQGMIEEPWEQGANIFASRLLAPACVLWGCGAYEPERIMQLCDISYQAAVFRAARMEELREIGRFLSSPLERAVYEQFLPFIREHRF
ncbi:MAG: ImmA/IrrE family metallo-endopeptidase [Clostridia bacterium]|nr:ImmA/IrrE family metallo-endopeptidase [Clostridia bacterium]